MATDDLANGPDELYDDEEAYLQEQRSRRVRTYFGMSLLAFCAAVALLWNRIVIPIHSGQAGILYHYFTGTNMSKVYGEGVHIILPFDRMYIYNIRWQTKERQYSLLSKDGLPIKLSVAIRYRPDLRMLPLLHVTVGPDYVNTVVFPETEAVLRRAVGNYAADEVYTSDRGFLESIVVSSLTNVENRYITIDDVLVRSVSLPKKISDAIENKLVLREQQKAYAFRIRIAQLEANRKKIEAKGIQDYQDIIKKSLTADLLRWQGIQATEKLATSPNAKTVVIGAGKDGLPLILGGDR